MLPEERIRSMDGELRYAKKFKRTKEKKRNKLQSIVLGHKISAPAQLPGNMIKKKVFLKKHINI
jgi:hypothetical protein